MQYIVDILDYINYNMTMKGGNKWKTREW
jgi:hypothetical protein